MPKNEKTENADTKQRPAHWFKPGQSGNPAGKPKGTRHKLTEDFVKALADDFDQHGRDAIVAVRTDDPGKYLDIVAKLVPKDVELNVTGSAAFERIWRMIGEGVAATLPEDGESDGHTVN